MLSALLQSNYQDAPVNRDPYAPAWFTAGWYDGITDENFINVIFNCYQPDNDLTNALFDAMEAQIAGDTASGDALMAKTKPLYKKALSGCG